MKYGKQSTMQGAAVLNYTGRTFKFPFWVGSPRKMTRLHSESCYNNVSFVLCSFVRFESHRMVHRDNTCSEISDRKHTMTRRMKRNEETMHLSDYVSKPAYNTKLYTIIVYVFRSSIITIGKYALRVVEESKNNEITQLWRN